MRWTQTPVKEQAQGGSLSPPPRGPRPQALPRAGCRSRSPDAPRSPKTCAVPGRAAETRRGRGGARPRAAVVVPEELSSLPLGSPGHASIIPSSLCSARWEGGPRGPRKKGEQLRPFGPEGPAHDAIAVASQPFPRGPGALSTGWAEGGPGQHAQV